MNDILKEGLIFGGATAGIFLLVVVPWVFFAARKHFKKNPYPTEGTPTQRRNEFDNVVMDYLSDTLGSDRVRKILIGILLSAMFLALVAVLLAVLDI